MNVKLTPVYFNFVGLGAVRLLHDQLCLWVPKTKKLILLHQPGNLIINLCWTSSNLIFPFSISDESLETIIVTRNNEKNVFLIIFDVHDNLRTTFICPPYLPCQRNNSVLVSSTGTQKIVRLQFDRQMGRKDYSEKVYILIHTLMINQKQCK